MGKRVYEIAKELGVEARQVLVRLKESGIDLKDHLATLTQEQEDKAREAFQTPRGADVQVKKIDGGRVVRRRVGETRTAVPDQVAAEAVTEEKVAEQVVTAEVQFEEAGSVVESVVDAVVDLSADSAVSAGQLETVDAHVVKENKTAAPEPVKTVEVAPTTEAGTKRPGAPQHEVAGAHKTAPRVKETPAEEKAREEEEKKLKPKPVAKTPQEEEAEARAKTKRLVYDRRRDVISLRDITVETEEPDVVEQRRPQRRGKRPTQQKRSGRPQRTLLTLPKEVKRVVKVEDELGISVQDLAHRMSVKAGQLIKKLITMGVMASMTEVLDLDTAAILAGEFGFTVERVGFDPATLLKEDDDSVESLEPRMPVVTVMGHVDHGKTTLLDRIREAAVAESEAGGITQHIGAYQVSTASGQIVFLDTPGHEAFTAMRARGAGATDIVILVVAADDGVMAQTREAISHAREAGAPIIVAVNKIDKPDANPERVRQGLSAEGLIPEDWGGDTIFCDISAKQRIGIEKLLEMILLQSEVMELKANPNKPGRGVVLEARLDKQLGPVATILVQGGTLRAGDVVIAGMAHGRVRRMVDDKGRQLLEAGPSTPVRVAGLSSVPDAGDSFVVLTDERKARELAEYRMEKSRGAAMSAGQRVTLEDFFAMAQSGEVRELKVIVKADVSGSLAPLIESISKLKHPELSLKVIHRAVGNIAESDVNLAMASNAVVVGFNVGTEPSARSLSDLEGVDLRQYNVIYDVVDDLRKAMEGLLAPKLVAKQVGTADVRQVFKVSKIGVIAGCYVTSGHVSRSVDVKVVRNGRIVFEGKISSLKRFKDDAKDVKSGLECGIGLHGYEDTQEGDVMEFYEYDEVRETVSSIG